MRFLLFIALNFMSFSCLCQNSTITSGLLIKDDGTLVHYGNKIGGMVSSSYYKFKSISSAGTSWGPYYLGLTEDGTVKAWGHIDYYKHKMDVPHMDYSSSPKDLVGVVAISAGYNRALALKENGKVVVWGGFCSDRWGYCPVPKGLEGVVAISAGMSHSLALTEDGTVIAWGSNELGQCSVPNGLKASNDGVGNLTVSGDRLDKYIAISAGSSHSLAIKEDGTVVAWGNTKNGRCDVPKGLEGVVAISAGASHSLALKEDGTVVAWGKTKNGRCDVPNGLHGVVAIYVDNLYGHSLALKEDGTVVAWGHITEPLELPYGFKCALPSSESIDFSETNKSPLKVNSSKSSSVVLPENDNISSDKIRIRVSEKTVNIFNIAVIGKESTLCDGSKDDGQGLAEVVEGELLDIYGVVERRHLEEILDEQRLAMSGLLLEDSDFAQAGCLAGAQGTVLASYGCLQGQTKLQVKLVDCTTSDLYWSATGLDVSAFDLMDALRVELRK